MKVSQEEMEAVSALDGPSRFKHFVKRVADAEVAWGLWSDGWALMEADDGAQVFPLWPAREYAQAYATDDWAMYEPEEIALDDLLDELLPKLEANGVRPGVFPTTQGMGTTPTVQELERALQAELEKY